MIDILTSQVLIHKKSSRFKGCIINFLFTNQSQVHPKGVTKAHVVVALSHIGEHSKSHSFSPARRRLHECEALSEGEN